MEVERGGWWGCISKTKLALNFSIFTSSSSQDEVFHSGISTMLSCFLNVASPLPLWMEPLPMSPLSHNSAFLRPYLFCSNKKNLLHFHNPESMYFGNIDLGLGYVTGSVS